MKVVELREALLAKGLSSKGLKKDLIERLEGYLEEASSLNTQSHLSQEITDKDDCNDTMVKLSASPIKSPLDSRQSRQTVRQEWTAGVGFGPGLSAEGILMRKPKC